MKINVFPIISSLHEKNFIEEQTKKLLEDIKSKLNASLEVTSINELYNADLSLILIQSGGSEQEFLKVYDKVKEPVLLLTYGTNNSLAASLEILSYLRDDNKKAEVLHGDANYIVSRLKSYLNSYNYGVIGKPSDWLIASNVSYDDALNYHNINLIDIDLSEVIELYNKANINDYNEDFELIFDKNELDNAKKMYLALLKIVDKYNLDGLTIRCFDLLGPLKTTACLALGILNSKGIVSACEGDIPSLISMHIIKKISDNSSFQANPSRIDINNKKMVFAHCTLPFKMVKKFSLDTHFESNLGVAIKGELEERDITIFKLSKNLKDYYVSTGKIIKNLNEKNLCRTQIEITVDNNINYFLERPYGNHHIIAYGNLKEKIDNYFRNI